MIEAGENYLEIILRLRIKKIMSEQSRQVSAFLFLL